MNFIKQFITAPEIWERASEDGIDKDEFNPSSDDLHLILKIKDKIAGICMVKRINAITFHFHPYLLKPYRPYYWKEAHKKFFKWMMDNATSPLEKLVTSIPMCFPVVKNCAVNFGFKIEGVNRKSYIKNGEILDQWNLGMTKNEILEVI